MTGSKVALDSVIGIYTEGGGDETVTLTDCTGYLGSGRGTAIWPSRLTERIPM